MIRFITLLALGGFLFFSGCQDKSESLSDQRVERITQQVETLSQKMIKAWNEQEYDNYFDFYAKGENMTFVYNGKLIRSWEAFKEISQESLNGYSKSNVKTKKLTVDVVDPHLAIATHLMDWDWQKKSGEKVHIEVVLTTIFRKRNGSWKIIMGAESFPVNY